MTEQTSRKKRLFWQIPLFVLFTLAAIVFAADLWYIATFGRTRFDSIIFTLRSGMKGTSGTLIWGYLLKSLLPALLVSAAVLVPLAIALHKEKLRAWIAIVTLSCVSLGALTYAAFDSQLVEYVVYSNRTSGIYESEYRDPSDVKISFPEEKRNLVCIVLESMETTYLSTELGGGVKNNLIPELYELAQNNVNFSHNDGVGGFLETTGATWSIGALVSQTSGIPIVPLIDANEKSTDGRFLPGVVTLMDLLHEQGYYQGFMLGSNSGFADTGLYYSSHGVDKIYDVYTAQQDGIIPNGYWDNWWGMEDFHLYEYAKQVLGEYAEKDQPFALTLMTIDTHTPGGHFCDYCEKQYGENYDNVISCASRQAAAFVAWLQQQPYYENTTVVILGDHRSMDNLYANRNVAAGYERHVYNCYINVADTVSAENSKNRQFTTQDIFPTTLAALGCTIKGDRLGLGTNLFSDEQTLCERIGYNDLCAQLYGDKAYYNKHFRLME